jgi:site-specific recombinase XerD
LSEQEWLKVKKSMPDNYIRMMFELLDTTGLRIKELLNLKTENIEFKED